MHQGHILKDLIKKIQFLYHPILGEHTMDTSFRGQPKRFQGHIPDKVHLPAPIPFVNGLFCCPTHNGMPQGMLRVQESLFSGTQELMNNISDFGRKSFYIYAHPVITADDSRCKTPAMGNGKMEGFPRDVRLARIGNQDVLVREPGIEESKQIAASQVLQPFMRVGDFPLRGYEAQKKFRLLFYMPNGQLSVLVDILLKKKPHPKTEIRYSKLELRTRIIKSNSI
jgi:hypothetical protein